MNRLIHLFLFFLVAGCTVACTKGMNNDEIIAERRKCLDAGMTASILVNGFNQRTVWCEDSESK